MKFVLRSLAVSVSLLSMACSGGLRQGKGSNLSTIDTKSPEIPEGYSSNGPWSLWIKAKGVNGELSGDEDMVASLQGDAGVAVEADQQLSVRVKLGEVYLFKFLGELKDNNLSGEQHEESVIFSTTHCSSDYQDDLGGSLNDNGWYELTITSENKDKIAVPVCSKGPDDVTPNADTGGDIEVEPVVVEDENTPRSSSLDLSVGSVSFGTISNGEYVNRFEINLRTSALDTLTNFFYMPPNEAGSLITGYKSDLDAGYALCLYDRRIDSYINPIGYYIGPKNGAFYNFNAYGVASLQDRATAYALIKSNGQNSCPSLNSGELKTN